MNKKVSEPAQKIGEELPRGAVSSHASAFRLPPSALTRILGIDPGSETTGWGMIETDGRRARLVAFGVIRSSLRERFAVRLLRISDGVEEIIGKYEPDVCAIEEGFYAVNVKTAIKLGQVRGVVLVAAERARVEIAEYAPRLVKQTVVGYGAAEKHQVGEMVRLLLNLTAAPQPHDAADALALAICHSHHQTINRIASQNPRPSVAAPAVRVALNQRRVVR